MPTDVRSTFALHGLAVASTSASAAALASAIAVHTAQVSLVIVVWIAIGVVMLAAAVWFRRLSVRWPHAPAVTPIFLALAICPYGWEGVSRTVWGIGQPLEIVLLTSVQLVGCGMAATSAWRTFQPLTMIAGLFVALFAGSISHDPSTHVAAGVFALCGLSWLVSAHWSALVARMPLAHQRQQPQSSLLIPLLGMLAVVLAVGTLRSDQLWALAGFMPSSGGDGRQDASANRGVGDGEALVAGEDDIQSFGPIEDAPFRASEDPSLYDLFDELYDEPVKVKNSERAIALPPDLKQQIESRMAKSERAGKEFSTARKQRTRSGSEMSHLTSDALFYVKGRVPLHLRHELFDLFDGTVWHAEDSGPMNELPTLTLSMVGERPWLNWPDVPRAFEVFGPVENHALKIVHLKSDRVPTPLQLRGIHIDLLDKPEFFQAVGDQLLRMDVKALPELTAIHVRSQTIDRREFISLSTWTPSPSRNYLTLPEGPEIDRIQRLGEEWTAGLKRGWPQIDALLHRLRTEYVLDAEARPPKDCTCPTTHFLFQSKRGPDYQFASAAALLLRSLGYPTRLVGGFYVSPDRYDRLKGHTPVVGADTHVWLEVYHAGRIWLTVEPTPGYEVLGPPPVWWERALAYFFNFGRWVVARWPAFLILAFVAVSLWWHRVWCLDRLAVALWCCCLVRSPRSRILQTARLINTRLWLTGHPRLPGQTWAITFGQLANRSPELRRDGLWFAALADWAVFAPDTEPIPDFQGISWDEACHRVVQALHPIVRPKRRDRGRIAGRLRAGEISSC